MITVLLIVTVLTIGCVIYLLVPLMMGGRGQRLLGWILLSGITVTAMGVYLWRGSPDIPSRPAMLETSGPDYERRAAVRQELALREQALASPGDADILLALGTAQLKNGRLEAAIATLAKASRIESKNMAIRYKLGAAYYASAINAMINGEDIIRTELRFLGALHYTPEDAPYRARLERDFAEFTEQKKTQDED